MKYKINNITENNKNGNNIDLHKELKEKDEFLIELGEKIDNIYKKLLDK